MPTTTKRIEICIPGCRSKFEDWIKNRGGVKVWQNLNFSNPGAGDQYTPARTKEGDDYPKPHWSLGFKELITDLNRFRFVKEMKEVKRFRVAVRMGAQGFMLKCTDASTAKICKACAKAEEQYNVDPSYHFDYDTQECVISIPIWEMEPEVCTQRRKLTTEICHPSGGDPCCHKCLDEIINPKEK